MGFSPWGMPSFRHPKEDATASGTIRQTLSLALCLSFPKGVCGLALLHSYGQFALVSTVPGRPPLLLCLLRVLRLQPRYPKLTENPLHNFENSKTKSSSSLHRSGYIREHLAVMVDAAISPRMSYDPRDTRNIAGTNPNLGMNAKNYIVIIAVAVVVLLGVVLFFALGAHSANSAGKPAPAPATAPTGPSPQ